MQEPITLFLLSSLSSFFIIDLIIGEQSKNSFRQFFPLLLKNLAFVYILSNDLNFTILIQNIMTMTNIVRFTAKREQIIQSRKHYNFFVEPLDWEKNHVSSSSDKDHAL